MLRDTAIQLSLLGLGEGKRVWGCARFLGDAIPDLANESKTLANGQLYGRREYVRSSEPNPQPVMVYGRHCGDPRKRCWRAGY
jgi:hypothetical protein